MTARRTTAPNHRAAIAHLRSVDPVLADIIDRVGRCDFTPRSEGAHFDAVLRAIVYQQLSGKAAATIHSRVLALFGGRAPTPGEILSTPDAELRSAGLSSGKTRYVKDLAARVAGGEIPIEQLHEYDDAGILALLQRIKGVGRWTAQMFLMFRLGRPDVLPELDLGIRKAVQLAYRKRKLPAPPEVQRVGKGWSPWSSVACWYLWRSLELPAAKPPKKSGPRTRKRVQRAGAPRKSKPSRRSSSV